LTSDSNTFVAKWRHDKMHNDIQHNDIQHNDTKHNNKNMTLGKIALDSERGGFLLLLC
jgi:hypothetical protein